MSGEAKVGLKASDRGSYYSQEALLSEETDQVTEESDLHSNDEPAPSTSVSYTKLHQHLTLHTESTESDDSSDSEPEQLNYLMTSQE